MIHSSHSKKDLIELIELFELWDIEDYRDLPKPDLQIALWSYVKKLKKIKPDSEFYFIDDVAGLMKYLNQPCPRQLLTRPKLEHITDLCKDIIFYSKTCSHCLGGSNYTCIDEVIEDGIEISQYGDLPIVRRALRLLNEDLKIDVDIEPVLTKRVKKKLARQEALRVKNVAKLEVSKGKVMVEFD
jgi:hypothetical protein